MLPAEVAQETALIGSVAARTKVTVAAKVMSYVRTVQAHEGDRVRAGQVLVELDAREMQAALEAAEAMRAEADAAIASAKQGVAAAEAQRDLAASTQKRFEELLGKKSVAQQEYDEVEARLRGAEAGLALARSQQTRAEAKRAQAEAAVAQAKLHLGYAKVLSPVNGVVVRRMADPGALASPGMPLLEIEQGDGYRLEVAAPESDAVRLRIGQEVRVRLEALGDDGPASGRIGEIVPAVDPGSRTFLAKIDLPNDPRLRSGLYGRAFLPGAAREALTVPASAVVDRGQLRSVFVVEDGRIRRRLVTLGEERDGRLEVLSGLESEDEVVVNPGNATDGARVGGRS
jgi:RND family efflux transporter MFP subunit